MRRNEIRFAWLLSLLIVTLNSGCAVSKIDTKKFSAPKTVVIDDFPDMYPVATRMLLSNLIPGDYFQPYIDKFFSINEIEQQPTGGSNAAEQVNQTVMNQIISSPKPISPATGAAMGAVGGIVGGLLQMHEEETDRKVAGFQSLLRTTIPEMDLRVSVLRALRESLEAKGISVKISSDSRKMPPRPHWSGVDDKGNKLLASALVGSPAVDADMLIQIVPVAGYKVSVGPVKSLQCAAGIGVALFNGRTREFIGWQSFTYKPEDNQCWYQGYENLAADVAKAGPALHDALVSLVPQIADTISGKQL